MIISLIQCLCMCVCVCVCFFSDNLQRRAASVIEGYTVSQTLISRIFFWPTLQSRRDYIKCMLMFKNLHGLASAYLRELSHSRDFHSYNTSHRDLLLLPLAVGQLSTRAPSGSAEPSSKTRFLWTWGASMILTSLRSAWKGNLDPGLTEPPLLLLYSVVPFFIFICFCVLFFLFHQGPIQTSLTELGNPD